MSLTPEQRARQDIDAVLEAAGLFDEGPDWGRPPVDGPVIESPQLDMGACSVLWLSMGEPHCLEIYAFGSHLPEVLDEFNLSGSAGRV